MHAGQPVNVLKVGSLILNSCACKNPVSIRYDTLRMQSNLEPDLGGARVTND
jgi:hypothetical protein